MVGFETPKSRVTSPTVAVPAAEPLDDVAAEGVREGFERIVSHFANYIADEDVEQPQEDSDAGPQSRDAGKSGEPSARSCSLRRRSSPAAATS